jgi:hypothetical protein
MNKIIFIYTFLFSFSVFAQNQNYKFEVETREWWSGRKMVSGFQINSNTFVTEVGEKNGFYTFDSRILSTQFCNSRNKNFPQDIQIQIGESQGYNLGSDRRAHVKDGVLVISLESVQPLRHKIYLYAYCQWFFPGGGMGGARIRAYGKLSP